MKKGLHKVQLTPQIIHLLTSIAEIVGIVEGVKLIKPSPTLRKNNRIRTIQSSLSIEGNSLTRDQVTALLDGKTVVGPGRDITEVNNAIRLYNQVNGLNPLSLESFLNAHEILMDGLIPSAGRLRKEPIGVIRPGDIFHEAPAWQQIEPLMRELFAYLKKSDDHWLLKSCRYHYQLEYIHPFVDGNGRMGRLWQTRLLMEYHSIFEFLPVEDLIKQNQDNYYRELAIGDDTGDCTGFVSLMLGLIRDSLDALMTDTRSVTLNARDRLEMAIQSLGKDPFSRKDYQAFFKTISTATASRDLQQGVKMGLLLKSGDKRTTLYKIAG
jgi:Fic family protein